MQKQSNTYYLSLPAHLPTPQHGTLLHNATMSHNVTTKCKLKLQLTTYAFTNVSILASKHDPTKRVRGTCSISWEQQDRQHLPLNVTT